MRLLLNLTLLLCFLDSIAQQDYEARVHLAVDHLRKYELRKLDSLLGSIDAKDDSEKKVIEVLRWKFNQLSDQVMKDFPLGSLSSFESDLSVNSAILHLYYGDYLLAAGVDENIAFDYFWIAKDIAEKNADSLVICESLKRIVDHLCDQASNPSLMEIKSEEYSSYAFDSFEEDLANFLKIRSQALVELNPFNNDTASLKPYVQGLIKGIERASLNKNPIIEAQYNRYLGVMYFVFNKKLESQGVSNNNLTKSIEHYNRSLTLYDLYEPFVFARQLKAGIYINKANVFNAINQYDSAGQNWLLAASLLPKDEVLLSKNSASTANQYWQDKANYHRGMATYLNAIDLKDSAFMHKSREMALRANNYQKKIDLSVAEIDTRYETEKKEREVQQARAERNNLLISSVAVTVLAAIALAFYLNRQRMMKLVAAKNEKLYNQEINQLLNEQELKSINSMLEGQEKERKRVAEDLHDRLGSTLTAVKMHVDVLSEENGKLDQVGGLLDKAITDTREIAHNMLSGVLTKFGLMVALRDLADTVEGTNRVSIELSGEKLDERLPTSVEINMYRIFQELISNTLKHAQASKIRIGVAREIDHLKLTYVDNGKGFNSSVDQHAGIGMKNIAARVLKIGGQWHFESSIGKGVSVEFQLDI